RENVLPHGIARTGVVEADTGLDALGLEVLEVGEVLRRDRLLRPARRQLGAARELVEGDVAPHPEVVVAGQAGVRPRAGQLATGVRLGSVADDVPQAPDSVHTRVVNLSQNCL